MQQKGVKCFVGYLRFGMVSELPVFFYMQQKTIKLFDTNLSCLMDPFSSFQITKVVKKALYP